MTQGNCGSGRWSRNDVCSVGTSASSRRMLESARGSAHETRTFLFPTDSSAPANPAGHFAAIPARGWCKDSSQMWLMRFRRNDPKT